MQGITVQVGRTGALTPVAELRGRLKSEALRSNAPHFITRTRYLEKDVRIGDTVVVQRAGDVIGGRLGNKGETRARVNKAVQGACGMPGMRGNGGKNREDTLFAPEGFRARLK